MEDQLDEGSGYGNDGNDFEVMSPFNHELRSNDTDSFQRNELKMINEHDHMPIILEETEFEEEVPDEKAFQKEVYQEQQTRLRRQTTESFVSSLQTIAPAPIIHTYDNATIVVGTIYPNMQGRKMVTKNISIRGLLRDVNNVGMAYDVKFRWVFLQFSDLNFLTVALSQRAASRCGLSLEAVLCCRIRQNQRDLRRFLWIAPVTWTHQSTRSLAYASV
jgi:hypothetical protein